MSVWWKRSWRVLLAAILVSGFAYWGCQYWNRFPEPDCVATFSGPWQDSSVVPVFSPSGSLLAVNGNGAALLDLRTQNQRILLGKDEIRSVMFRTGGESLVSVSGEGVVQLWDVKAGKEQRRFHIKKGLGVFWAGLSPDEKTLVATGNELEELIAWDVASGRPLATFGGDGSNAVEGKFSPDGSFFVTYGPKGSIAQVWSVPSFKQHVTLSGHSGAVFGASFAPDGKTLATTSYDAIRLWKMPTGNFLKAFHVRSHRANCLAFSPDGRALAAGCGGPVKIGWGHPATVELWDIATEKVVMRWTAYDAGWVTAIAFSPDGTKLATAVSDGEVKVWRIPTSHSR